MVGGIFFLFFRVLRFFWFSGTLPNVLGPIAQHSGIYTRVGSGASPRPKKTPVQNFYSISATGMVQYSRTRMRENLFLEASRALIGYHKTTGVPCSTPTSVTLFFL